MNYYLFLFRSLFSFVLLLSEAIAGVRLTTGEQSIVENFFQRKGKAYHSIFYICSL